MPVKGALIYGHGGNVAGYDAEAYFEPRSKIGVIVLRNACRGGFVTMNLVRAAFESSASHPKEIALTPEEAAEFVGHFGEQSHEYTVSQEGGQLSVKFADYPAAGVFRSAKDEFFMKVVDVRITFERDPDGKINGLVSRRNGRGDIRADKKTSGSKP